jgi:hypothetical protein
MIKNPPTEAGGFFLMRRVKNAGYAEYYSGLTRFLGKNFI